MNILIVDDEREIADVVELYLQNEYNVLKFYTGEEALACIEKSKIDLAILDVMLPDLDGFTILKKIREKYTFPVIMLTAKSEYVDKITGLTLGADDYIPKPFNPLELVARVKAQMRRYTQYNDSVRKEKDDDVIDFANREMSNVVLSLDGRKEIHDRFRVDYAGKGSWENIVPKFQKLVEARGGKDYYMRGTFTHNNVDFTNDLFHMADLGFTELSMEPVVCAPTDPYALTEEDLPKLFEQYELLAKEMIKRKKEGRGFTFYHYMIDLSHGPCIYKRISGCGSGTEYMAVTPWGDLYPCHQFVGDEAYLMGNVWDGVKNTAMQEKFRGCNAYSRPECKDCWAKLYCSGGCAANAYHATGDISGIYEYGCKLFRKRMECAIMIKAAEADM